MIDFNKTRQCSIQIPFPLNNCLAKNDIKVNLTPITKSK